MASPRFSMGGGVSISDLRRIERAGPRAAFGFKSTVNVWASLEDSVNPYAKPISSVKYENHMTYEAMMYMALTAFASGSTYFQNCYIGLVDGSKASGGVSNFTDAASTITTGTVNYPTTNDWAEMTNYTQGVRQALVGPGIAPTTRTPSGGVLPFAAPSSPAVTMTGGTGGGSISGIFYICGQSAFGVSAVQSWWASNYTTNGPVLMSVAIGSIQSFTAAEVITVTPITFTATAG